jgi:hypothetical protein
MRRSPGPHHPIRFYPDSMSFLSHFYPISIHFLYRFSMHFSLTQAVFPRSHAAAQCLKKIHRGAAEPRKTYEGCDEITGPLPGIVDCKTDR